jgi:hypothetical protein
MKMKRNIGGRHQTVQFMIASGALTMGLFAKRGWLKALGLALGGPALATAITRHSVFSDALSKGMRALRRVA